MLNNQEILSAVSSSAESVDFFDNVDYFEDKSGNLRQRMVFDYNN